MSAGRDGIHGGYLGCGPGGRDRRLYPVSGATSMIPSGHRTGASRSARVSGPTVRPTAGLPA
ncbi:hypothetical protein FRUB_00350 [Fimbriiglobus ruber]|uniref:Uncharacterized protein n=1 Tax=Fimbriiglobus ruber TaxID=1908690 RepID=A0A225DZ69_9BACT|nr:hypothetical protein FRUB_00350 [Fimbriiglobus ruber]